MPPGHLHRAEQWRIWLAWPAVDTSVQQNGPFKTSVAVGRMSDTRVLPKDVHATEAEASQQLTCSWLWSRHIHIAGTLCSRHTVA